MPRDSDKAGQLQCSTRVEVEDAVETSRERSEVFFLFSFSGKAMQLQRSLFHNVHLRTGGREWEGYDSHIVLKGFSLLRAGGRSPAPRDVAGRSP